MIFFHKVSADFWHRKMTLKMRIVLHLIFNTKSSQIPGTFLWPFSYTFGLAYSPLNSSTLSCSSEVTLTLITSRTHCCSLIFTDFLARNVWAQAQKTINKAYHTNTRGDYQKICVESKPGKVKGNLHPEIVSDIIQWLKFENFLKSCPFVKK